MNEALRGLAEALLGRLGVPPPLPHPYAAPDYAAFMRREIFRMNRHYARRRVDIVGLEHLPASGGAVLTFLHHGSFFLSGLAIQAQTGLRYSAIVTGRNLTPQVLGEADFRFWKAVHGRISALYARPVLYSNESPRAAIRWLREGGLLGVALDVREQGHDTIEDEYPWRGGLYRFPRGPARLAAAAGVPLVPMSILWAAGPRRHVLRILPPAPAGGLQQQTAAVLKAIGGVPSEHAQWFHPIESFAVDPVVAT